MDNILKLMVHNESGAERRVHSNKCLVKEVGEVSEKQLNSISESSRIKEANSHTRSRQQEIIKLVVKINKVQTKI